MIVNPHSAIAWCWGSVGIVWLAGAFTSKSSLRTQTLSTRLFHLALAGLGFTLLSGQYLRGGWLELRFIPASLAVEWTAVALTAFGCAFAIWARMTIGTNWSSRAELKRGHELVKAGPYGLVRHPIYTGLLAAVVGTALEAGEMRCLLAIVLIVLSLFVKMAQEERIMVQAFPTQYPEYRHRVRALIPYVF